MNRPTTHFIKALILIWTLLLASAIAVPNDNNPATRAARFSWSQEPPDAIVTAYHLYYWKDGTNPSTAVKVVVPSPPQEGQIVNASVVEDGFEQGAKYHAFVRAASGPENYNEESADSEHVVFVMPKTVPTPGAFKVEIQLTLTFSTGAESYVPALKIP